MRNLVGQVIDGKYRVIRHVGVGGIAEVYEAAHEQIGQRFALKVLRREFAEMTDVAERMMTEARAASAVGHPGIVQVFDIGKLESGEPYLVMELLQGDDLMDILRRRKRLSLDQAVGICLHLLDALGAAHRAGVLHRDLKPENVVLVRGPGGEPWAKIIDFGIARMDSPGEGATRHTAQGTMVGTPYYVSPEQARCVANIDGRSDLYAVGVMLFEMVTGKLPFEGTTANEIVTKVLSDRFPEPRSILPDLPRSIEDIILRATLRDREARYQTAEEFSQALRELRGELVAVKLIDEDDPEFPSDEDPSVIRRLDEIGTEARPGSGMRGSVPPPERASGGHPRVPSNPPPGRGSGTHPRVPSNPPPGRFPSAPSTVVTGRYPVVGASGARVGGAPPPPPRMSSSRPGMQRGSVPATAGTVVLHTHGRPMGWIIAGTAVAVAAATVAVFLLLRSGGSPDAVPAPGPSDPPSAAVSSGDPDPATRPALVPQAVPILVPVPRLSPVASAADAGIANEPADGRLEAGAVEAPPSPPTATVRLVGMPAGATATVDDEEVGEEFVLEPSEQEHVLRVKSRGRVIFFHPFTVAGDMEIRVEFRRTTTGASDAGTSTAAPPPPPPPPPPADGGAQPLANPFQ